VASTQVIGNRLLELNASALVHDGLVKHILDLHQRDGGGISEVETASDPAGVEGDGVEEVEVVDVLLELSTDKRRNVGLGEGHRRVGREATGSERVEEIIMLVKRVIIRLNVVSIELATVVLDIVIIHPFLDDTNNHLLLNASKVILLISEGIKIMSLVHQTEVVLDEGILTRVETTLEEVLGHAQVIDVLESVVLTRSHHVGDGDGGVDDATGEIVLFRTVKRIDVLILTVLRHVTTDLLLIIREHTGQELSLAI
jgi:hypothetical protein